MRKWLLATCGLAGMIALESGGCAQDEALTDGFTATEWSRIHVMGPATEPPADPTNKYERDERAAALGQRLFFEKGFSGPLAVGDDGMNGGLGRVGEEGKVACASCHQGASMIDEHTRPRNVSLGADWVPRKAGSVINASFYSPWIENDGCSDSLWSDALIDPEAPISMNGSRLRLAHVIFAKYRSDYDAIFTPALDPALDPSHPDAKRFPLEGKPKNSPSDPDGPWEQMNAADQKAVTTVFVNFGKAVHAYMRRFVSVGSSFDKYAAGDYAAIGADAKRGLRLFIGKANCVGCHTGFGFTDNKFHDTGLHATGPHIDPTETGRLAIIDHVLTNPFNRDGEYSDDRTTKQLVGVVADPKLAGQWRTKGLRNVTKHPLFMHTGQFDSIRKVIDFYNQGGDPDGFIGAKDPLMKKLNLTDAEIADLIAFLETLVGEDVPPELRVDTSAR